MYVHTVLQILLYIITSLHSTYRLQDTDISDEGVSALAGALCVNCSLKELKLVDLDKVVHDMYMRIVYIPITVLKDDTMHLLRSS